MQGTSVFSLKQPPKHRVLFEVIGWLLLVVGPMVLVLVEIQKLGPNRSLGSLMSQISTDAKLFALIGLLNLLIGPFVFLWNRMKESERVELSPKGIRFFRNGKIVWVVSWSSIVAMTTRELRGENGTGELLIFRLKDGKPRRIQIRDKTDGDMPNRDRFFAELRAKGFVPVPEKRPFFKIFGA